MTSAKPDHRKGGPNPVDANIVSTSSVVALLVFGNSHETLSLAVRTLTGVESVASFNFDFKVLSGVRNAGGYRSTQELRKAIGSCGLPRELEVLYVVTGKNTAGHGKNDRRRLRRSVSLVRSLLPEGVKVKEISALYVPAGDGSAYEVHSRPRKAEGYEWNLKERRGSDRMPLSVPFCSEVQSSATTESSFADGSLVDPSIHDTQEGDKEGVPFAFRCYPPDPRHK